MTPLTQEPLLPVAAPQWEWGMMGAMLIWDEYPAHIQKPALDRCPSHLLSLTFFLSAPTSLMFLSLGGCDIHEQLSSER